MRYPLRPPFPTQPHSLALRPSTSNFKPNIKPIPSLRSPPRSLSFFSSYSRSRITITYQPQVTLFIAQPPLHPDNKYEIRYQSLTKSAINHPRTHPFKLHRVRRGVPFSFFIRITSSLRYNRQQTINNVFKASITTSVCPGIMDRTRTSQLVRWTPLRPTK